MMTFALTSLSQLASPAAQMPQADAAAIEGAIARQNSLTKPPGSLGKLEELAVFMAGWRGTARPAIASAQAVIFAGNHGICAQGVNPYPQEVTAQMVGNFTAGGAAINQLCRANNAKLSVIALDLDNPTADFTTGPAMSDSSCLDAINRGAAAVDPQADVLILGEMGIGNSTIAAALTSALFGGEVTDWVGPGTGSDAAGIVTPASLPRKCWPLWAGANRLRSVARFWPLAPPASRSFWTVSSAPPQPPSFMPSTPGCWTIALSAMPAPNPATAVC
jgi:nicotinate-nucleotide--dimethylbenzimidazole phosphoribosyltransferase